MLCFDHFIDLSDSSMHTESPIFIVELSEIYSCPPLPEKEANEDSLPISRPFEIGVAQELHGSSTFESQIPNKEPGQINTIKSSFHLINVISDIQRYLSGTLSVYKYWLIPLYC